MGALSIVTSSGPADGPDDAPAVRLISAITVGDRYRKDMGDLDALAASIREHGLLHPVVITVDGTLVAGERRLRACALLGWKHVPVTVVDVPDLLRAERDENEVRKAFAPAEAVAIGRVIEQQAEAANKERRRAIAAKAGRASAEKHYGPKPMESDMTKIFGHVEPLPGTTLSAVARAVGMSEVTYSRAKAVVKAAEADPAAFGDLAEQMDRTGQVHGAYNTLRAGCWRLSSERSPSSARSSCITGSGRSGPTYSIAICSATAASSLQVKTAPVGDAISNTAPDAGALPLARDAPNGISQRRAPACSRWMSLAARISIAPV